MVASERHRDRRRPLAQLPEMPLKHLADIVHMAGQFDYTRGGSPFAHFSFEASGIATSGAPYPEPQN